MARKENISSSVIKRLPRYYRFLGELKAQGIERISSKELSEKMHTTASQVRQDFNCFGGFGQQGFGYNVEQLYNEIKQILGLNNHYKTILIGVGNLGRAVASHMSFEERGFKLIGIFDQNPKLFGQIIRGITVQTTVNIEDFCTKNNPEVAILCIPKTAVGDMSKRLYNMGIKCYWNFSHYDLSVDYDDVIVKNVHMSDSLMILCYKISNKETSNNIEN